MQLEAKASLMREIRGQTGCLVPAERTRESGTGGWPPPGRAVDAARSLAKLVCEGGRSREEAARGSGGVDFSDDGLPPVA